MKIPKQFRTTASGFKVFRVNGTHVRKHYPDWIGGSHWYADPKLVPKGEIWIERMRSTTEERFLLAHELAEIILMKYLRFGYAKAHAAANVVEQALRKGGHPDEIFERHLAKYWPRAPRWQRLKGAMALASAYRGY